MIPRFEKLTEQEFTEIKNSIPLITVLIAGADGSIDNEELEWAEKITKIRAYSSSSLLNGFYKEVGKDFEQKLSASILELPSGTNQRTEVISKSLEKLNSIFTKLDREIAYELYTSLLSFAKHVAKSSGGFLGFFRVSSKEKALMTLPMIHPVEAPIDLD